MKPKSNEIILRPIRANLGVESAYRKQLKKLLKEMRADVDSCLQQHYPRGLAQDGLFDGLQISLSQLLQYWAVKLGVKAEELAEIFIRQSLKHTDNAFQAALRQENIPTVQFTMDNHTRAALQAAMQSNVGLIRSIGQQYLSRVEQDVWNAVSAGYDLAQLTQTLRNSYGISERRAAFIARDQTNKAKAN